MNEEQELKAVKRVNKELDMIDNVLLRLDTDIAVNKGQLQRLNAKKSDNIEDDNYEKECINKEIEILNYVKDLMTEKQEDLMNALRSVK